MKKSKPNIIFRSLVLKIIIVFILLLFVGIQIPFAQAIPSRAHKIEAIFLFNFTRFVNWPPAAFDSANAPIVIGILGKDPFGSYIDETVKEENVLGHPIVIQRYKDVKEIKSCHVLFINYNNTERVKDILSAIKKRDILTVSEMNNFDKLGGMIRFFIKDNQIRLEINPASAKESGLDISSKLLGVAQIYNPPTH